MIKKVRHLAFLVFSLIFSNQGSAGVFDHQSFTLKNGLTVYFIKNPIASLVNVDIYYKVGSADDRQDIYGISHFLEHMMFKGTTNVPKGHMDKILRGQGGTFNAYTTPDVTCYQTRIPADQLELVLFLEADRMQNLTFTADDIASEKEVVFEERAMRLDNNPFGLAQEAYLRALYWNHPYSVHPIGYKENIAAYTFDEVRKHYNTYYAPNNAYIVITGDADFNTIKKLVEKYYGDIPTKEIPKRNRVHECNHGDTTITIEHAAPRIKLTFLHLSYLAPHFKQNKQMALALQVLAYILGGNDLSRFKHQFIEKEQNASEVDVDYKYETLDPKDFSIGVSLLPNITIEEMKKKLFDALQHLVEKGITEQELADAQRDLLAPLAFAKDGIDAASTSFQALAFDIPVEDIENQDTRIKSVTLEQVNEAAKLLFSRKPNVILIMKPDTTKAEVTKKEARQAAPQ